MTTGLPEPAPGYRWQLQVPESAPRRRRPWRWVIGTLVVFAFLFAGAFAGEWLARDLTENTIRGAVVAELGVPADQPVDVQVPGLVLPQLIVGTLDEVRVSAQDVALGPVQGAIDLVATGVPVRGGGALEAAHATLVLSDAQVRTLLGAIEGFPADTVGLAAPNVTMTYPLEILGASFPVGVGLTPSAAEGDLVLTPAAFRLGEAEISADALRDRFGTIAGVVLGDWRLCIAEHLPAGMTLDAVSVTSSGLDARFAIAGGILSEKALQNPGSCE